MDNFVKKYDGQVVDTDGYYGGQCMDLMHKYIVEVLGLDLALFAAPTAYEAYKNANDPRFDKIANTPTGVPSKGDIVFWNTTVGSAGHVAIFIEGDTNSFRSFDQNWPTGSKCHIQNHDYKGVAGWLHPKNQPIQLDTSYKGYDLTNHDSMKVAVDILVKVQAGEFIDKIKYTDVVKERDELQKANITLNTKVEQLTDIMKQDAIDDRNAEIRNQALETRINAFVQSTGLPVGTSDELVLEKIKGLLAPHTEVVKNVQPVMDELANQAFMKRAPKKGKNIFTRLIDAIKNLPI